MDSFKTKKHFKSSGSNYTYYSLPELRNSGFNIDRLPFSLKIILENLLRHEDGESVNKDTIAAICNWEPTAEPNQEISFMPARVLLQDFTGVPAVVDLAAMRDTLKGWNLDPQAINPLSPSELVIDHSVQVDYFGDDNALAKNTQIEFERNNERYEFLKWGQEAFSNFMVIPPSTGIVHQVNLEYLARVVMTREADGERIAYPDTLVGTDSHTTMINGLGVLGWGVGGIEAEAVMLGQATSMLIPLVVGFKLEGKLASHVTATDLVLKITQMLREKGVVGRFVEFYGEGLSELSLADRATVSNMAPEYGATCGIFPIDEKTLDYLRLTGRSEKQIQLVEDYMKAQELFVDDYSKSAVYTDVLSLNLAEVEPNIAGPKRPQDRISLADVPESFNQELTSSGKDIANIDHDALSDGSVVIAAITSCTNTSNASVMLAAGLLAKKAADKGLNRKSWVKTSLAPGSKVVIDYLEKSKLMTSLEKLGFYLVGFGCTTCIGNSGPIPKEVADKIDQNDLLVASVLSGNRNFEGRINARTKVNYLASPPLVVAYAIAGRVDIDFERDPIGQDSKGKDVFLRDIWPSAEEIQEVIKSSVSSEIFKKNYANVTEGDDNWKAIKVPVGETYEWQPGSTYIKKPPFFEGMTPQHPEINDIQSARVLVKLGDSVTTDHISPAGSIAPDSPAARYLKQNGVSHQQFNSYGSRRGNHEVMMRGTFANIRLRNQLVKGVEGGHTIHFPDRLPMTIFDAAVAYRKENTPLVILAGKEYGTGSSRDWAAKGPKLLGIRAVIAESYERIHRSNLIGMGILPLQFLDGESADSLNIDGSETFDIQGIKDTFENGFTTNSTLEVVAHNASGQSMRFSVMSRIDTPMEARYFQHGGILNYVLRRLAKKLS